MSKIVGIDLGTTNSLVAFVKDGKPEVLTSREGKRLVPSVVPFAQGDQPVVGCAARAKKIRDASQTVFSAKRLLGRGFKDVADQAGNLPYQIIEGEGLVRIQVGDRAYTAIEVSAMILRELKLSAESALGEPVTQAVITVPAYFNDSQRQATRAAGRLAGLDVLRIINEPTAAALAYGLDRKKEGLIAVYDLGGGTFDVSILKLHNGIFEVLSTHGDTTLGGDDLDQAIVAVAVEDIRTRFGMDPMTDMNLRAALIERAEDLKIALSEKTEAVFRLEIQGREYTRAWTRAEFEDRVRPVLERTRIPVEPALKDAGLKREDLSDVILVGGPTRLKVVRDVARAVFGREPNTSMHPDEVVATGAAIQADILAGNNNDLLLLDVVPLSLGMETYGDLMSVFVARNTRIPTVVKETFTTFVDNQTAVDIHILQGERDKASDNRSLARFKLRVPPQPAGMPRVEVTFLIDADGTLQVAARDVKTGVEQAIEVRPSYGLTDAQIDRMVEESYQHAAEDIEYRKVADARNEALPTLRSTESRLDAAKRLLSREEYAKVEQALGALRAAIGGTDIERMSAARYDLDQATVKLADLISKENLNNA